MNILVLGDVVSQCGCEKVRAAVPPFKRLKGIDLCLANGENSAKGNGITPESANALFSSGVDFITTGNHAFRRAEMYDYFEESDCVIRPYNYPPSAPGRGVGIIDMGKVQVGVINLSGTMFMENLENPFYAADRALEEIESLLTSTRKQRAKSLRWRTILTAGFPPFSAPTPTFRRAMSAYCPKKRATSPTSECADRAKAFSV